MRLLQGPAYDRHVGVGGSRGSRRRAAGVGLVSLVIYLAAILGSVTIYVVAKTPDRVMFGGNSVFYSDGVSRGEAERVGEQLVAFAPQASKTSRWGVEVRRNGERPVIAFVMVMSDINVPDEQIRREFHEFAEPLSRTVYGGAPVDIWLVDGIFRPRVKLPWELRPR